MIHRAEDDAGGLARGFHHVVRQGGTFAFQGGQPDVALIPFETKFEFGVGAVEHRERRLGDFGADAVAGEYENLHGGSLWPC